MVRLVSALRAHQRGQPQSGFALVMVLTAIAVFSIVVVAMLSMVLTDLKVQPMALNGDSAKRAVDGALQAALNQLKIDPSGSLGQQFRPCYPVGSKNATGTANADGTGPGPYTIQVDPGQWVRVTCDPSPSVSAPVPSPPVPTTDGTAVTLTGGYTGFLAALASNPNAGQAVNKLAQQLDQQLASKSFGLFHNGPEPLVIDGDVNTNQFALGYRSDFYGNRIGDPAIKIVGSFTSAQTGFLANSNTISFFGKAGSANYCGTIDPTFYNFVLIFPVVDPYYQSGLRMQVTRGPNGAVPVCGVGSYAANNPNGAKLDAGMQPPVANVNSLLTLGAPNLPATCPKDALGVVRLSPGFYDMNSTAVLNQWFAPPSAGTCDNATFWFQPGDYYFDVASNAPWFAPGSKDSLRLLNSTDKWVFGAPATGVWNPATGQAPSTPYPPACDVSGGGVSITLSPRTSIHHEAGLAWVCGQRDDSGNPKTLVYQQNLGDSVLWAGSPASVSNTPLDGGWTSWTNPNDAVAGAAITPAAAGYNGTLGSPYNPGDGPTAKSATLDCYRACSGSLTLNNLGSASSHALAGTLGDVSLKLQAQGTPNIATSGSWFGQAYSGNCPYSYYCSGLLINVRLSDGKTCQVATKDGNGYRGGLPLSGSPAVVSLNECKGQGLVDAQQLDGATVEIQANLGNAPICWYCSFSKMTYSIDYAWLEATINQPSAPSSMSTWVDTNQGRSISYLGPVSVPRSQVDVNWQGGASLQTPIFSGGLQAKALASWPSQVGVHVGLLAAAGMRPANRTVLLRARIAGRLRGSAIVSLTDATTDAVGNTTVSPGSKVTIQDWRICNEAWPSPGAPATPCGQP